MVDRGRYGADTLSTHGLMRAGVLQLHRWGVLDRIVAAGTPAIRRIDVHVRRPPADRPDQARSTASTRCTRPPATVLDPVLVDAAGEAGADVRFGVTVTGLQRDVTAP